MDGASRSTTVTILIRDPRWPETFLIRRRRLWTQFRVALLAASLDRDLAAGKSPESSVFLASRAQDLMSPASRMKLRDNWERVLTRATKPTVRRSPYSPLTPRVIEARPEIRHLIAALGEPLLDATQGVAMAELLLTDGAGALYNPQSTLQLRDALRDVTRHLDLDRPTLSAP
jgi:hypothetical protein